MISAIAKLSTKAQTVLPRAVRAKLDLKPGDSVRFVILGDQVIVEKHVPRDDDPFHAFSEWASDADEDAYGKL